MAPLRDVAATHHRRCGYHSDRSLTGVRRHRGHIATDRALAAGLPKKVDPPGGTTGRVGFGTEVDEAPVPDANPREAFEVVWSEKPLLKQQPSQPQKSVTAGTHAAHVIAVSVELANPAAAAIAVVVTIAAGGDGGADDGGANEAGSDAPAERLGLRLGGGSDRAGN